MEKETRLRRLYFRSVHRGSKETDLILGRFAQRLHTLSDGELEEYERFLEESDNDIWDWVAGTSAPPDGRYEKLVTRLREGRL